MALCWESLTPDENKASALATCMQNYSNGKAGTKTALLREILAAIELNEENVYENIDGEAQDRKDNVEKSLIEVSTKAHGNKGGYNNKNQGRGGYGGGRGRGGNSYGDNYNNEGRGRGRGDRDKPQEPLSAWEKQAQDETIAALKANAKKNMEAVKADKDDIQKVRICLNQITMDNYDSKKDQLRKVLFGDRQTYFEMESSLIGTQKEEKKVELAQFGIDEEKETIVVKTIFRKAAAEPIYVSFYATLCSDIVRLELEMKGYEPKKSNVKHCSFRT